MRHSRIWTIVGAAALSLLALSACGGDDDNGASATATLAAGGSKTATATGPASGTAAATATASTAATATSKPVTGGANPCELVTQQEAEAATGETFGAGQVQPQGGITLCLYIKEGGDVAVDPFVGVQYS